jgi:hypothetical protein
MSVVYAGPERRKVGRPPIADGQRTQVLHVRLADDDHDRICQLSIMWTRDRDEDVSKLDVIREAVRRLLESEPTVAGFVSRNT